MTLNYTDKCFPLRTGHITFLIQDSLSQKTVGKNHPWVSSVICSVYGYQLLVYSLMESLQISYHPTVYKYRILLIILLFQAYPLQVSDVNKMSRKIRRNSDNMILNLLI